MKPKVLLAVLICTLLLSGCFSIYEDYKFRQDFDQIVSIEILKKEQDLIDSPMNVIKTIDPAEHRDVINALLEAEGARLGLEPGSGFGMYIIRITYLDGEMELIGNYNNGYVSVDGELHQKNYTFDRDDFYAVISKFLGEETYWPQK